VDAVGVAGVSAWNSHVAMGNSIRQTVADVRVWRPNASSQPPPFLDIHQEIAPHVCEVASLQQLYFGLTEPVGKNDAKLPDVCMRPAIFWHVRLRNIAAGLSFNNRCREHHGSPRRLPPHSITGANPKALSISAWRRRLSTIVCARTIETFLNYTKRRLHCWISELKNFRGAISSLATLIGHTTTTFSRGGKGIV
jgi:hypothetical protein